MEPAEYETLAAVEERHWWWRARREILGEVIARFLPEARFGALRIADVGCGSGGNLTMLSRFGTVLGVEASPRALALLHTKHGDRFHVVQHSIPDVLPGRFDVLAMFDVLEHVEDDARAMRWAADHLAPGGVLVVTVPAFRFLWTDLDEVVHHRRRYTRRQVAEIVPDELEVLHLTYFNSLLFFPIAAVRAVMNKIPRRGRAPRSHFRLPPAPINALFYRLFRLERHLVPKVRLPLGVSALLVARRVGSCV